MRKLSGILTLALLMATTMLLAGKPGFLGQVSLNDPEIRIVAGDSPGIYRLQYLGSSEEKVRVRILDDKGHLVHSEVNGKQDSFSRSYDLQQLPEGTYYLEVWGKKQLAREKLEYRKVVPQMLALETKAFPKDRKVQLKVKGATETAYMVRIYDRNGEVLFQDQLEIDPVNGRMFNFEQTQESEVHIVVYNNDLFADTWVQIR